MLRWLYLEVSYIKMQLENNLSCQRIMKVTHFIHNTQPLPTEKLKPYEILSYRDECYKDYHNNELF